jgi:phosphoglycerate dehydrogenase-like enzyme
MPPSQHLLTHSIASRSSASRLCQLDKDLRRNQRPQHPSLSLQTIMASYKSFAIWGAGNIGARIAVELLARAPQTGTSVIIVTRPVSLFCDVS